ncbi:MAG TPA: thioredoxin domain-containing protein [Jiangellaceae bacterium]|nr:thioredoxin domain-containing protein [Jiangellaceae bacterium]
MSAHDVTTVTDTTFDDAVAEKRPVLVDFWAEGREPCKAMVPILAEIARERAADLGVATVRLDDAPELARRFEIMALPTLIVFVDGQPAKRIVGASNKRQLLAALTELLP